RAGPTHFCSRCSHSSISPCLPPPLGVNQITASPLMHRKLLRMTKISCQICQDKPRTGHRKLQSINQIGHSSLQFERLQLRNLSLLDASLEPTNLINNKSRTL